MICAHLEACKEDITTYNDIHKDHEGHVKLDNNAANPKPYDMVLPMLTNQVKKFMYPTQKAGVDGEQDDECTKSNANYAMRKSILQGAHEDYDDTPISTEMSCTHLEVCKEDIINVSRKDNAAKETKASECSHSVHGRNTTLKNGRVENRNEVNPSVKSIGKMVKMKREDDLGTAGVFINRSQTTGEVDQRNKLS
jgi:hypothetical protein